jgi:tRNA nucleotidyltransferase (CCA-adding enzyme)
MQIVLDPRIRSVLATIEGAGGQPFLVGGFVRDRVMRRVQLEVPESKDVDIEVFGLSLAQVSAALGALGRVLIVGASFGVLKLTFPDGEQFDVSMPRRESKAGTGHRGFVVETDGSLNLREAASRRDFTINSLAADSSGSVVDLHGGIPDIEARILRAVSERFSDDPLRVLRGMQFASRFGMSMDARTATLARGLLPEFATLSAERIWGEWSKWARGAYPQLGLDVLVQTGWLEAFPGLEVLRQTPQDPIYHPEGDVFAHSRLSAAQAAAIARSEGLDSEQTETLVLASALHDLGKASTTRVNERGRITSYGHAAVGAKLARQFLAGMRAPEDISIRVATLVREHMVHTGARPEPSTVARLARRLGASSRIEQRVTVRTLALLARADASGRSPAPPTDPMASWVEAADGLALTDNRPEPILKGRHLLALGMSEGPELGAILRVAFEAQLNDQFNDLAGAHEWLERQDQS